MPYTGSGPKTDFQKVMRAPPPAGQGVKHEPKLLYNHNPQPLPPDDLYRCEHIPLKKGACWRDLGISPPIGIELVCFIIYGKKSALHPPV